MLTEAGSIKYHRLTAFTERSANAFQVKKIDGSPAKCSTEPLERLRLLSDSFCPARCRSLLSPLLCLWVTPLKSSGCFSSHLTDKSLMAHPSDCSPEPLNWPGTWRALWVHVKQKGGSSFHWAVGLWWWCINTSIKNKLKLLQGTFNWTWNRLDGSNSCNYFLGPRPEDEMSPAAWGKKLLRRPAVTFTTTAQFILHHGLHRATGPDCSWCLL